MDKSKNLRGHLFALTANVMWGLMSPIGKSALQEFSAISVPRSAWWEQPPLSGYFLYFANRNM